MDHAERTAELLRLRPRLLRRARRFVVDWAAAEDLVQEALLLVWTRLAKEPPIDDLERYLFRTLRNLAFRSARPMEELDEANTPHTAPDVTGRLATTDVLEALAHLPDMQASLILDHAMEGVSYAELARRHRLPLGTVMSRVARGRARLRSDMQLDPGVSVAQMLRD